MGQTGFLFVCPCTVQLGAGDAMQYTSIYIYIFFLCKGAVRGRRRVDKRIRLNGALSLSQTHTHTHTHTRTNGQIDTRTQ